MSSGSGEEFAGHGDVSSRAGRSNYWESLWKQGVKSGTMFDNGGPTLALKDLLENKEVLPASGTALVPGCGRGYDCALLSERYETTGVELSESAAQEARAFVPSAVKIVQANFFDIQDSFDVVFDCTFLCALHPESRQQWAEHMAKCVNGYLISLVFPIPANLSSQLAQSFRYYTSAGPPYSLSVDIVKDLLIPVGFELVHLQDPLPPDLQHLPRNPFGARTAIAVFMKKKKEVT